MNDNGDDYDYAVEAEEDLPGDELQRLEEKYAAELRSAAGVSADTKFLYAYGLVRSRFRQDQLNGIRLLQEILRKEPSRKRETLWYLSIGYFRVGDHQSAQYYNDQILYLEPQNRQARSLAANLQRKLRRDGLIGLGVVSAAVGVLAMGIAALASRRR